MKPELGNTFLCNCEHLLCLSQPWSETTSHMYISRHVYLKMFNLWKVQDGQIGKTHPAQEVPSRRGESPHAQVTVGKMFSVEGLQTEGEREKRGNLWKTKKLYKNTIAYRTLAAASIAISCRQGYVPKVTWKPWELLTAHQWTFWRWTLRLPLTLSPCWKSGVRGRTKHPAERRLLQVTHIGAFYLSKKSAACTSVSLNWRVCKEADDPLGWVRGRPVACFPALTKGADSAFRGRASGHLGNS